MNKGTVIRTILAVATTINTILMAIDVTGFNNEKINLAYKILSVVVNAVIIAINTYYNNDYTEEACVGTGLTRQLKAERNTEYEGERFFEEVENENLQDTEE